MEIDRGKKLLLVEDEAIIAMVTAKMLKKRGYEVITVNNGRKAVETALIDTTIDLILMDIDLGAGINGPEAARQILQIKNLPIVFLTSHSEQDVVEMVREITRYGYVIKNSGDFVLLSSIEMAFELFASHESLKASAEVIRKSEEKVKLKLESILSPDGDIGDFELEDIVDIKMLQSIMEDYNTVSDVCMAIVDVKGKVLVATGWQDICTKFHRVNPDSCSNCVESDTILSQGVEEGTYKLYKCRNNMWDISTPIVVGGKHVANVFMGQFLFDDDVVDYDLFRVQSREFGFDENEYMAALDRVPRLRRDVIFNTMAFLIKLSNIISKLSYSNIKLAKTLSERDRYSDLHKESEVRLSNITDYMVDLVARLDNDGFFTYVSPSYERILGYRPDELAGTWAPDLAHPSSREKDIKNIRDLCNAGEGFAEFRLRHKDGTYRWFEATGRNIFDEKGSAAGAVMGARDITERKKAEKKLNRKDRQYKELFESMIDGFAIHEIVLDEWGNAVDYIFLEVNPAFEQITGLSAGAITGKRVSEIIPDLEPYWITTYGQVALTGVQLTIENYSSQLKKWFKVTAFSYERGYFATIFEDITDRRTAQELLKESDDRYKRLFDSVVGYVYTVFIDNKTPVKTVHGPGCEAVTGYTPDDFVSDPELWYKVIYPEDRGRVILFASDIINKGVFNPIEHRIICRDGSISWVRNTPVPHYDSEKNLLEYDSVISDITERKNAENSLKDSREMLLNIINSSPDYIYVKDTDLRLVLCNEVYADAMNSRPEELIGKTDIESGWGEEFVKGNLQKGIRGYENDDLRVLSGEKIIVESEPANIKGEIHYFNTIKVPLYKNGKITSLFGISRDITGKVIMEKKLRESERKFRAITENAPLGVYMTDKAGDCVYANRRWLEMAGFTPEEAAGKGWENAIHPDDRESISEKWYRSVDSGGAWGYEYRFLSRSGKVTWVHGNASAVSGDDGKAIGYVGTNLDISEKVEFLNILNCQKEKYRTISDFTYDWEFWIGTDGSIIYCSPSCERITGYTAEEFMNDSNLFMDIVFPEDSEIACIQGGELHEFPDINVAEFRIKRKDGDVVWIGHACRSVYDKAGNFAGRRGSNRDITEQKKILGILTENELRFRNLVEHIPIAYQSLNTDGNFVDVNENWIELTGYNRSEVIGKSFGDFWDPSTRDLFPERFKTFLSTGYIDDAELSLIKATGEKIVVVLTGRVQKGRSGEFEKTHCIISDITERIESFEKINSLLKEKEMLLSEVHHRIKNNMNTISGLLMLQAASISDPAAVTALNDARSRVQSMMIMYDKLYRSEDYRKMSVKEYLEKFIDEIFMIFENSNQVRLEKDIEDFVLDTKILFPIGIIINELITNAFKYAFPGGREGKIIVSVSKADDAVTLVVKDDGAGVPDKVASSNSGGFGLNLVSALTEQIGGEVKIKRDNGTVVEIAFKLSV